MIKHNLNLLLAIFLIFFSYTHQNFEPIQRIYFESINHKFEKIPSITGMSIPA